MTGWMRAAAAFALGCLFIALPAIAAEECDSWFPDLTCHRSGRFAGFEKPIVQPYLFEDPFITTGLYPYYVWHAFPKSSALEGGEAHVAAAQIRVALTDRFAVIATKDGYMWKRPDNPLLPHTSGWMNFAFGAKYAFYQDRDAGRIASFVLKYEAPSGAADTLQGSGDGMLMPSVSGAARLGDLALQGDLGGSFALEKSQSDAIFYHLYAGYPVAEGIMPFVQLSGMHWTDGGDGSLEIPLSKLGQSLLGVSSLPVGVVESIYGRFEGADVANLGTPNADGLDLVTAAVGLHVALVDRVTVSLAYERPITGHKGIFKQRVTTNVALEF